MKEEIYYKTCIYGGKLEIIPVKCETKKIQTLKVVEDTFNNTN